MSKENVQTCFRTSIGGQALIEGILMRGPDRQAIVCRTGEGMTEKVEELKFVKDKHPVLGWPFIRGIVIFADSMIKGMGALSYSASLLPEEEQEEPTKLDLWLEKKLGSEKAQKAVIAIAAVLGVVLALALFLFLPTFLKDEIPQEHKDGLDIARDYLRRSHVLVVCGHGIDETVKNDIATADRLRITATTLDGILTVKGQGRGKGGARHA